MDFILLVLGIIAAQTTYLTVRSGGFFSVRSKAPGIICDTSALIDGRIVSIARSGFLSSRLIVPKSVVRELQFMADRADHAKRERARYGLDVIKELQDLPHVEIEIYDDGMVHDLGVDEQLIMLAKKLPAKLCTTDYNLNKVAQTEQITVVNVNELAHALRPMHLPGERIMVGIVASGQNKDQGVGYLDDGSMVVVDNARSSIGKSIEVETVRVLQTEAGRMVFARLLKPIKPRDTLHDKQLYRHGRKTADKRQSKEDELINLANR